MKLRLQMVSALVVLSACSSMASEDGTYAIGAGSDTYPSERLNDWVSYADEVSILTVVSERQLPPPQEVLDRGEGYIGRSVTLRVEDTLWLRKGIRAPVEFEMNVAGWVLRDGGKQSMAIVEGGPRLEVGDRFLAPLAPGPDGRLGLFSSSAVLLMVNDKGVVAPGQDNEAIALLKGLGRAEIASRLADTSPDPLAESLSNLPAFERARAVIDAKASGGSASTP